MKVPLIPAGVGAAATELFESAVLFEFELLEVEFEVVEFVLFEAVDFLVVVFVFELVAALLGEVLGVALAAGVLFSVFVCAPVCAEVSAEAPARVEIPLEPNCGGVIESTAPRPPTVPPAINNARFMPLTSLSPQRKKSLPAYIHF